MATINSPEARAASKQRVRALVFFVLAATAGVLGVYGFRHYAGRLKGSADGAQFKTKSVVVAKMPLPIATRLQEEHLEVAKWPEEYTPIDSFAKAEEVVGRTLQQALHKGEPILKRRLADKEKGDGLAALLGEGMRAMAVKVNAVVGVAGFVRPGDYVDVITTMTPDEETRNDLDYDAARVSKIILQNIKVLAVGEHLETQGRNPVKYAVVTLEVDPEQSERLALGSQHGRIQLTMRSRIDQTPAATAGTTPLKLLMPDEGAQELALTKPEQKSTPKRTRRARKRSEPADKPEPSAVVEILRGNRIEERKLSSGQ